jgi:DNA-directed RNA polymerase specialized sigma54-like protein
MRPITFGDLIFDEKVFDFLGQDLEAKYLEEIKKNPFLENNSEYATNLTYDDDCNQDAKDEKKEISENGWTESQNKRLIMLYKKNLPESALANIFKKSTKEIRAKIIQVLKD